MAPDVTRSLHELGHLGGCEILPRPSVGVFRFGWWELCRKRCVGHGSSPCGSPCYERLLQGCSKHYFAVKTFFRSSLSALQTDAGSIVRRFFMSSSNTPYGLT